MDVSYQRDMNHNYLILKCDGELSEESYETRMIFANNIPGLLPCHIRYIDGRTYLGYDVTSRQSLNLFCESRKPGRKEIKKILGSILGTILGMEEFLLDPDHLILDPELIHMNFETQETVLAFAPFYRKEVRSSLRELTELPLSQNKPVPANVDAINSMTIRNFRNTIAKSIALGKKGVCEDLEYLAMSWFDADVSCYSKKDTDVSGIMLFHERPSGIVSIALMVSFDQDFAKTIPGMMRFFVAGCREKYSLDTPIHFSRHNQPSFLLSEKLLPRGFGSPVYEGERLEK